MQTTDEESWDAEYRRGRYIGERPVDFVEDIIDASRVLPEHASGVYIGCGNGRNYLPLRRAGLNLIGLDISQVALDSLAAKAPEYAGDLVHGTVDDLPAGVVYSIVIALQVFQHGNRQQAHEHLKTAARRVAPGGLFCVRVNSGATDLDLTHEVTEPRKEGSLTVRYLEGPKNGLQVHFFSRTELESLLQSAGLEEVLPARQDWTKRAAPRRGGWAQWEAIYRRPVSDAGSVRPEGDSAGG